ncbi:MAG: tocopherol cyclase family protein, partial [Cyanobacteria bacterium P01_D01_bin.71]
VRVPTRTGLQFECWDTTCGRLGIQVWERSLQPPYQISSILKAQTHLAALEVGGQGWHQEWHFERSTV